MRHLWSLLAGLVAAPLAWLCLATGQHRSERTVEVWYEQRAFDTAELIGPAAFLVVAGLILGLLGTLRVSPLGPAVAGLLLIAPTGFLFRNPFETLDAFSVDQPWRLLGQDLQPWLPVQNGTMLVLGALLLVAVASASRWRRWPTTAAVPAAAVPAAPAAAASARPTLPPVTTRPVPEPADAGADAAATPGTEPDTEPGTKPAPEPRTWSDDEILAAARDLDEAPTAADTPNPRTPESAENDPPERRP